MGEGYESDSGITPQENENALGSELVRGFSGVERDNEMGAVNGETHF